MPKIKTSFRLVNPFSLGSTCRVEDLENKIFKDEIPPFLEWVNKKRKYGTIENVRVILLEDVYIYKKMMKIKHAKDKKLNSSSLQEIASNDELKAIEINEVINLKISRDEKIKRIEEIKNKYKKI